MTSDVDAQPLFVDANAQANADVEREPERRITVVHQLALPLAHAPAVRGFPVVPSEIEPEGREADNQWDFDFANPAIPTRRCS